MSLPFPSLLGSLFYGGRARKQKREGDGRENGLPSRALSPLYIGISDLLREEGRDIYEFFVIFAFKTSATCF